MSRFALLVVWVCLALWHGLLGAQPLAPVVLDGNAQEHMLRHQLKMVRDDGANWGPLEAFEAAVRGATLPIVVTGKPYRSDKPHWAVVRIAQTSSETDWVLYYRLATLENVQAYARSGEGAWLPLKGLHHQNRTFAGYHYPSFALALPKGAVVDLAVRVETRAPIRMPILAVPGYHFYEQQRRDLVLAGMAIAVPLIVLLYLVLLMPRAPRLGLGWFVALIALEVMGSLWVSGHGHVLFPDVSRQTWPVIGRLAYASMTVVGWLHLVRFVGEDKLARPVIWGGWGIAGAICAAAALELLAWANTRDLFIYGCTAFAVYAVFVSLLGQRRGVAYAGVYALAWSMFVASAALSVLGLLTTHVLMSAWTVYSVQSSAAALLFGLVALGHVRAREQALARAERENQRQQQALKSVNDALKLRLDFFAATNHDLRQPLQTLSIYLDLALRESVKLAGTGLTKYLHDAKSAYASATQFLDSLLDVARIENKVLSPELRPTDIAPHLLAWGRQYQVQAGRAGLELRLHLPQAAVVQTDVRLLERVVRNLLSNAIRYTPSGGVLLALRRRGAWWRLDVVDTGQGFDPVASGRLFEAFKPGHQPARHAGLDGAGSVGLGLYVVKQLSDALGHRVALRSRQGRGSCVSVLVAPAPSEPAALQSPQVHPYAGLMGKRVALIEGDREVALALEELLRQEGATLVQASDWAAVGAALAGDGPPDVLITSGEVVGLPQGDGSGLQAIRETGCPIVVISGDVTAATLQSLAAVADEVLLKPVEAAALLLALQRVLRAKDALAD